MINVDGKVYRNIQEQVKKNKDDIEELKEGIDTTKLKLSDTYLNEVSANTIVRPYLDGSGEYQEMVNNVEDTSKNSKYQKRMNFDGTDDKCYIDTHLGSTSSIYTAVTGENSAININVLGDDSLLFAQLDGYSNIRLMSKGDNAKKALNYILLGTDTNDEVLKGAPLLFLKNDGENAPEYGLAFDCQTNKLGYVTKDNSGNITFSENNDYVSRLNTSGYKVYAHSGSNQFELDYNILATANSIAQRDSNANIKVGLALSPDEALNLTRATDFFVSKLSTSGDYVYSHSGSTQKEIVYSALPIAESIVYRAFDGNFCSGTPSANEHVVNKGYVDNLLSKYVEEETTGYELTNLQVVNIADSSGSTIATLTPVMLKAVRHDNVLHIQGCFYLKGTATGTTAQQWLSSPCNLKIPESIYDKITTHGSTVVSSIKAPSTNLTVADLTVNLVKTGSDNLIQILLGLATTFSVGSALINYGAYYNFETSILLSDNLVL